MLIDINKIKLDPSQPRKIFNEKYIQSLANNLKTEGLIHPIEIDKDFMIIVGEYRYRAAKLLGWQEISVTINNTPLTSYERLRRQMSENLHQSGSKNGGDAMNPIDTAKGFQSLLKLSGHNFSAAEKSRQGIDSGLSQLSREIGIAPTTIWEYLQLLAEPKYVIDDMLQGRPKSYYWEAKFAPEPAKDKIKKKIAKGEYRSKYEIRQDVTVAKQLPSITEIELQRNRTKNSSMTNKILNNIVSLGLTMKELPLEQVNKEEKNIVIAQLNWLQKKIEEYINGS